MNPIKFIVCKFVGHMVPVIVWDVYYRGQTEVAERMRFCCERCGKKNLTIRDL